MAKFFGNLHLVLVVGLAAAIALMMAFAPSAPVDPNSILRWLHLFFGVLWIGLLYYLNFVQVPTMPSIPDELKPAVSKHIAPKVLFFFRWAAALTVLTGLGMSLDFWKIAMRPGKPLMVGKLGDVHVLGLPGNPVSSLVCAHLFLRPLLAKLAGRDFVPPLRAAVLGQAMKANDHRRDYVRAKLVEGIGNPVAQAFGTQDSSMLRTLADANCLIIREADAPEARQGDPCQVLLLR